jgi:DNA repair exonuclease SbcCD ATPase subunit
MTTEVVRRLSPEGEELAARREELARLEAELTDRELVFASLRAELAGFEGLYLRRVGVLYAELDEWNARLAELRAERLGTPEAQTEASEARSQAQESYSAAHGEAAEVEPFAPSLELKSLYREAAKKVHPDTASDERDRARRERIMKEVNAAYEAGDEDALRRILADLENCPDTVQGSGIGADLVRILRQLRQVRNRIEALDQEISILLRSDTSKLKAKAEAASADGRDLLEEMAISINVRVEEMRRTVYGASKGGH